MTASLALYQFGTRLLEPLAPWLVERRLKSGKERPERIGERFGLTGVARPPGRLVWLHGASVGESQLLLNVFAALRRRRPDASALVTTQTLTSADMIASQKPAGVIHQMAPVDGPGAVRRFLQHWRPDAAIFAEGEIWPNMLAGLKAQGVPAALVNARMTTRTLTSWRKRPASAHEVFSAFSFIGAADQATADGLKAATGRIIETVGNLKTAMRIQGPAPQAIAAFRKEIGDRPVVLAASTHPGEDDVALDAFLDVRALKPGALIILVPRHPERGEIVLNLARERGLLAQQWSKDRTPPAPDVDALVADTIGELLFWYALADAVYLGGATREGVGGHNPVEPAQLGKRVFTGPHGFNFRDTYESLKAAGMLAIGATYKELADFWLKELEIAPSAPVRTAFAGAQAQFRTSVAAIVAMLPEDGVDA